MSLVQPHVPAGRQTFENHAQYVPAYHLVAFPILTLNLLHQGSQLLTHRDTATVISFLLATSLVLMFFYTRIFALKVQDRVIRLEMRLRLREVLPPDLQPRIPELSLRQLVALRFASDEELPSLVRRVVEDKIENGKAIKRLVKNWQADTLRA